MHIYRLVLVSATVKTHNPTTHLSTYLLIVIASFSPENEAIYSKDNNLKYDSILERKFHEQFPDLVYHENNLNPYRFTFYDDDGNAFNAAPDFYCEERNIVIELKGFQLNNVKTKNLSIEKLLAQDSFKGKLTPYDKLKFAFNHSLYKQGTVNRTIRVSNYQYNFLLVFEDKTKISTQSQNKMKEEGIDWCYVSEWQDYQFDKVTH